MKNQKKGPGWDGGGKGQAEKQNCMGSGGKRMLGSRQPGSLAPETPEADASVAGLAEAGKTGSLHAQAVT